ncbi:LuxR family transcriptional regulator [Streptomyces sp. F-3]|uniref:LuxR family transcriptional regulator n=1 Tax=Streptomyces thermogriseus TaxID=75292 RepID=A0ABN1SV25_9ACTN|nr:LuxR C-terminal-related transcriptional regulator [Streptomyces sp. F-3]GAT81253.1 LuxR family transcriptional regulator [Streptomyces sp. F-3]
MVSEHGSDRPRSPAAGTDPLGDPFLRTCFAVPVPPAAFLHRPRLTRRLGRVPDTPLTVVDGCAGAGKTLLVADWAARLERPVAWFTVDSCGRAPGVFWAYLLEALRASGAEELQDIGAPADAGTVDHGLLTRLAARLDARDRPVTVVLDAYDRVTALEITDQLGFVLHHAGRGLRLVLVTRVEPTLPLHRCRADGTLTEIRDAELAFTPEEAAALLELHGLHLGHDAVRALVARTRGWAAGLRLCALAARQSGDPEKYLKEFEAGQSTIADFLLAEVLERQPPATQDLLLRVSVLDRFCPDLADALTGRRDAGPVLAELHRSNAFVEYLGHAWYRLHPLFAEILKAHLRMRLPGLESELHRRAARWLRHAGPLSDTLAHGAAAGDWEFTARALVDDLALGQFFTGLRSGDLDALFARMPPGATGPEADLVRAARELAGPDRDRACVHLERARRASARAGPGRAEVRLGCALLDTLDARLAGAPDRAEHAARTARELWRDLPAALLDRHPELPALLRTHLGAARLWAGRFDDARAVLSEAAAGRDAATAPPREEALGLLALIDLLTGWPTRAERAALAALADAERFSLAEPAGLDLVHPVLAAVAVDRDELDDAQALLDRAAAVRPVPPDPVTAACRVIARACLQLARGRTEAALETAGTAVPAAVASPWAEDRTALVVSAAHLAEGRPETAVEVLRDAVGRDAACTVAAARAHLAAGDPDAALHLLDRLPADRSGGPAVTVRALLVRAEAAVLRGDPATARRLAVRALADARRERLRRPLLEAGPSLRRLLRSDVLQGALRSGPADRPGARGRIPPRTARQTALVVEELSGRERDVLRRLARMMSTEEIAADLFVSVNTVKTHLKSAYRKLGVNRRSDAVHRARELRLL